MRSPVLRPLAFFAAALTADADISVTVNELVALRAVKNAGFDVPQETIDRGVKHSKRSGSQVYRDNDAIGDGHGVGPIYDTAVFAAVLAMPYHYTPLYQH